MGKTPQQSDPYRQRSSNSTLVNVSACIAGAVAAGLIVGITAKCGVGLSPDSAAYISAARSALHGDRLVAFDGQPLVVWPPVFPLILALFSAATRQDPLPAARILNAIVFGAILAISMAWIDRVVRSPLFKFLVPIGLISVPLMAVSTMAWSEPLYILLTLLALVLLAEYRTDDRAANLYLAAVAAGSACLTRYIGVTLILTGIGVVFLQRESAVGRRARQSMIFVAIATLPLCLWLIRNELISHTLMGPRSPSGISLATHIRWALDSLTSWFMPVSGRTARCFALAVVAGLLLLGGAAARSSLQFREAVRDGVRGVAAPMWLHVGLYAIWLLISALSCDINEIDTRYLSPIFVPTLLVFASIADSLVRCAAGMRWRTVVAYMMAAAAFIALFFQGARAIGDQLDDDECTACATAVRRSEIGAWLRRNVGSATVYSNAPWTVYMETERHAFLSPRYYASCATFQRTHGELEGLGRAIARRPGALLVWYLVDGQEGLYPVSSIAKFVSVRVVYETTEGKVYLVSRL